MIRTAAALRVAATLAFVAAILLGGIVAGARRAQARHTFDHRYPPNPRSLERPKVSDPVPRAELARTLHRRTRFSSWRELAFVLPHGTLVSTGRATWRLTASVDLTRGATLSVAGGTLALAPGAFLQARSGGSISLTHMTIAAEPSAAHRGFLVARDGGRLVLRDDVVRGLGHLGALAYGISLRAPAPGSEVTRTRIDGNYFGVFLSRASGVSIVGNTIVRSAVYGIDPYGASHDDLIAHNHVVRSGLHGIVLARNVVRVRVLDNLVVDPGAHGIVLYDGARVDTVARNTVVGAFDGIVLTRASDNRLLDNRVVDATRFGVRVSHGSAGNVLRRTSVSHALLGIYVYGGAAGTRIVDSVLAENGENVRVRADAGPTVVSPRPPLSELP